MLLEGFACQEPLKLPLVHKVDNDVYKLAWRKNAKKFLLSLTKNKKQLIQLSGKAVEEPYVQKSLRWMASTLAALPKNIDVLPMHKVVFLQDPIHAYLYACQVSCCRHVCVS